MSSSNLSQLRATLDQLESYELPKKYSKDYDGQPPVLDKKIVLRYHEARDEYLKRRMQQVFYEHVGSWDGSSFEIFPVPTSDELHELKGLSEEAQAQVSDTARNVNRKMELIQQKYNAFLLRREELGHMVSELEHEKKHSQDGNDDDDDDYDMDKDTDEEEIVMEEKKLADLTQRKAELEAQVRSLNSETAQTKESLAHTQRQIRTVSPDTVIVDNTLATGISVEEVKTKTSEIRERVEELREMSQWYDSIRATMEELGGIKILSVENLPQIDNKEEGNCMHIKFQILGKHEIMVEMSTANQVAKKKRNNAQADDELFVSGARFLTSTQIVAPLASPAIKKDEDNSNENNTVVQMRIPSLDDLVKLSANLGPIADLQFLIRESMARIRTITSRVEELALLRTRYLTKIGKCYSFDYGYGGEDQEIVCSLNEGIAVVLRLSPDCPMINGSVYVERIAGVGGWCQQRLDDIRDSINMKTYCGPLTLMDALVSEINRMEQNEEIAIPRTPSLPFRRAP